jgi:hypothetical protein
MAGGGGGGGGERRGDGVASEPNDGNEADRGNGVLKGEDREDRGTGVLGRDPGAALESMLGSGERVAVNGPSAGLSKANSSVASGRS